jgi:RsiW-degrading membrane proteinase PrsW (M82 family)
MTLLYLYLALAPALAIALYIYWKDKNEKEPITYLTGFFLLGALTCIPAGITNSIGGTVLGFEHGQSHGLVRSFFMAFFVVGLGEELFKFLALMFVAFRMKNFNEPFDGIVYSVMIGLGFASLENIMYVFEGGIGVAFMRTLTAVPMHAAFGIIMGYYVGKAKFLKGDRQTETAILGLAWAIFFHGAYDFCLFQNASVILLLMVFPIMGLAFFLSRKAIKQHLAKQS